ncbi:MAG: Chromosome-partitioning protein Spo0J [Firmicutes bacterium ADurb.Bin300]|nr:MAG: Chromosome-partitioning protein Spo0J [Firmicutes bacterium ADurb.Bin300]HOD02626.1 ParB/RepB/Spo0J family partition protein [Clostridiales bacterium]
MAEKKRRGLGKGYGSIFLDNAIEQFDGGPKTVNLSINEIEPNRSQPRQSFDDESLAQLSDSIKLHGVIQPLLVRPIPDGGYQIVAGERRWRAARLAGLTQVPVVIRELDDSRAAQYTLVENLQREDLNPIEEARGFKRLCDEFSYTQEEAASIIGRSRSAVANSIRLLSLPDEVVKMIEDKALTSGHGKALLSIQDEKLLVATAQKILQHGLSVRDAERLTRNADKVPSGGRRAKKRNPFYDEAELALSQSLGRRVKLTRSANRGSLQIEFFDDEDLLKLIKIFENEVD